MSLLDDLENAFQACLAPFTNPPSSHVFDNDELKANMDNVTRFLDISRQLESFFLQKRAILADQRPEMVLSEEISELKMEITKKDALLNKYHDKLNKWTSMVNDASAGKPINLPPNPAMMPMRMNQPMGNMGNLNQMKMQVAPNSNVNPSMMHPSNPMINVQIRPQAQMIGSPMNPQIGAPNAQMQFNPINNQSNQGLQGPLAYLERTTSNIGMLDNRR